MKWLESRILWGSLLVVGGVVFLLQNLDILPLGDLFWSFLFALAGVFFLSIFGQNRANYWSLIPGGTLISIAILVMLNRLLPELAGTWGGAIILGGIGLSFLAIYLVERANWWALIPMGVMATLALVAGLDEAQVGIETGAIFFIGLGVTFGLVALSSGRQGDLRWAWLPAVVLLAMGVLLLATAQDLIRYAWPLALILVGGYLALRALRGNQRMI